MATQQNVNQYAKAIQAQLSAIISPVPVYANFNRNFATQPEFVTWQLRNVHQDVYTGIYQNVKGIDSPVFQISVFSGSMENGFLIANQILQALHGYSGLFGGATYGFQISKADVMWLYNGYDNEINLFNIFMDCTIYIPT
ncbi:hypothetical protein EB001_13255 [bacterium]|jgi:hypothetical protein|nr:hypothetical protein [bacterium]